MTGRQRRVLRALVDLVEGSEGSVDAVQVAERVGTDHAEVSEALDSLGRYEFVKRTPGGRYAPTVTGREFLALDVDEEAFVVVDVPDDQPEEPDA